MKASVRARRQTETDTVRRDPHRVTTKLEPDASLGPQAPFKAFFGAFTAPRHRTLT